MTHKWCWRLKSTARRICYHRKPKVRSLSISWQPQFCTELPSESPLQTSSWFVDAHSLRTDVSLTRSENFERILQKDKRFLSDRNFFKSTNTTLKTVSVQFQNGSTAHFPQIWFAGALNCWTCVRNGSVAAEGIIRSAFGYFEFWTLTSEMDISIDVIPILFAGRYREIRIGLRSFYRPISKWFQIFNRKCPTSFRNLLEAFPLLRSTNPKFSVRDH